MSLLLQKSFVTIPPPLSYYLFEFRLDINSMLWEKIQEYVEDCNVCLLCSTRSH
jgi:hypothetical protein